MRSSWKSLRYQLEWLGVRLLAAIVPRLPRPVAVQFAGTAGAIAAHLDRQGRRVALSNLEAAFGDRFSAAERARITRQSYQQFAATMIDLFWSPRINAKNYRELIDLEGFEEFARTVGPTGPCIFAACHYGNFEWSGLTVGYLGMPGTIIAQEFKNPKLDPIFNRLRQNPVTRWPSAKVRLCGFTKRCDGIRAWRFWSILPSTRANRPSRSIVLE